MKRSELKSLIIDEVKKILREDTIPGGKGDESTSSQFDNRELEIGIAVEMEHTSDKEIAKEISQDHLTEDPKYYSKLIRSGLVDEPAAIAIYNKYFGKKI